MEARDKYKSIIVLSYVFFIICAILLFISVWNNLSLNPDIRIGNGIYFLLFAVIIFTSIIFILHLLEEHRFLVIEEPVLEETDRENAEPDESSMESYSSPYEIDVDVIAETIVPRIDPKEPTSDYTEKILRNLAKYFELVQGVFYLKNPKKDVFESVSTYAYASEKAPVPFKTGEGIPGQVAKNKTLLNLRDVPEGYLNVESGLGESRPRNLVFLPLLLNKETVGIIEIASFHEIDREKEWTLRNLAKIIGNATVTKMKSENR